MRIANVPVIKSLSHRLRSWVQVAEGIAHVYPRLAPTCEWDTAAAHIIVTEAGGSVIQAGLCDNKGNAQEDWKAAVAKDKPVVYNKENTLNPFFVVYGRRYAENVTMKDANPAASPAAL